MSCDLRLIDEVLMGFSALMMALFVAVTFVDMRRSARQHRELMRAHAEEIRAHERLHRQRLQ